MVKGQAAFEFLVNYGWMILIVIGIISVLFSLGIFNSQTYLPERNTDPSVAVMAVAHNLAPDSMKLTVRNTQPKAITVKSINISGDAEGGLDLDLAIPAGGESEVLTVPITSIKGGEGSLQYVNVVIDYENSQTLLESSSNSSLVLRVSDSSSFPVPAPALPSPYSITLPGSVLTFAGSEEKTISLTLNKTCSVSSMNFSVSGSIAPVGSYSYYSITDEPESDGIAESYQATLGDYQSDRFSVSFLVTKSNLQAAQINSFSMKVGWIAGNPQLKNFIYDVAICPTALSSLSSWSSQCNGPETRVLQNYNASTGLGNTRGWKVINFTTPYYIDNSTNYVIRFNYVSSAPLDGVPDQWDVWGDSNTKKGYVSTYPVSLKAITIYYNIPQIKLSGNTISYPSNVGIDVSGNGQDWNKTGILNSTASVSGLSSQIQAALSACSDPQCAVPLVFHSDTAGQMGVSDFEIGC